MAIGIDTLQYEIMSKLGEYPPICLTPADMINAINDAHKDITAKALCVETETSVTTTTGSRFITFTAHHVNKVKYSGLGLLEVYPATFGHLFLDGTAPQYYFVWNNYVLIEPVPDSIYPLTLFTATAPALESFGGVFYSDSAGFTDGPGVTWNRVGTLSGLPEEFYPSITDFCLYALSFKLKQWKRAVSFYHTYISNLAQRKADYINRISDSRQAPVIPSTVTYQRSQQWAQ